MGQTLPATLHWANAIRNWTTSQRLVFNWSAHDSSSVFTTLKALGLSARMGLMLPLCSAGLWLCVTHSLRRTGSTALPSSGLALMGKQLLYNIFCIVHTFCFSVPLVGYELKQYNRICGGRVVVYGRVCTFLVSDCGDIWKTYYIFWF
jgi:hypothetical protein